MTVTTDPVSEPTGLGELVLEASGLSAGYGGGPVINELVLAVRAGEVVALLGAIGAGKSTTLLTLAGEVPASSGTIRFGGDSRRRRLRCCCLMSQQQDSMTRNATSWAN